MILLLFKYSLVKELSYKNKVMKVFLILKHDFYFLINYDTVISIFAKYLNCGDNVFMKQLILLSNNFHYNWGNKSKIS